MVIESLIGAKRAEKYPWQLFFLGMLYASVALFFSIWIFRDQASLIMVFLTVVAAIPLMYKTIKLEEKTDLENLSEMKLLRHHAKALTFLVIFFMGMTVAFSIWFTVLPSSMVETTFKVQVDTISSINSKITGGMTVMDLFSKIFFNNLKVLIFCVLFAFFYGAGAIFILTWNSSVISAAIGTFFRNNISTYANAVGLLKVGGYFHIFSISILRYMTHGVLEILAYFMGALASGIISIAVIRHDVNSKKFKQVMFDALNIMILAIFILVIASFVEVFITPALF